MQLVQFQLKHDRKKTLTQLCYQAEINKRITLPGGPTARQEGDAVPLGARVRPRHQGPHRRGPACADEPVQVVHQGVQGQEGEGSAGPGQHAHKGNGR